MHLTLEHYLLVLRGEIPAGLLDRAARLHLLEVCDECRKELGDGLAVSPGPEGEGCADHPVPALPEDELSVGLREIEASQELKKLRRKAAREARTDLNRLLRLPMGRWRERVERARTRFRSRAFTEVAIEESRRRVRSAPEAAEILASLVPTVLSDLPAGSPPAWARELLALAAAHRANALRVGGDLPAAESRFSALMADLETTPLAGAAALAEVISLQASLRCDQRRFAEAGTLLDRATVLYTEAGEEGVAARTLVMQANRLQAEGATGEVLRLYRRAAELVEAEEDPYLYLCAITGQVNALCDLSEAEAAERLLTANQHLYLRAADPHTSASFGFFQARIDLERGRYGAAETGFREARDRLVEMGRAYDSVAASLFLAETLLAGGKWAELRKLAGNLVSMYRARGVARETLAALRLLAEAVREETITTEWIARTRRILQERGHGGEP